MGAISRIVAKIRMSLAGHRIAAPVSMLLVVSAIGLLAPNVAHAQFEGLGAVAFMIVARICQGIAALLGDLLIIMVGVLINVAQYDNFVSSPAVGQGWVLIRDTTNMFFILIMLLIAFGTMLGLDQYSYKNKTVNKLLLAALFVNFSRTFCGLMIDFSQVVMLTFVYGFRAAGGGNFLDAFQLNTWLASNDNAIMDRAADGNMDLAFSTMLGVMLACILALIALVVVTYMTVMLVVRIVMLWLLVVISPAAFFLRAVPLKSAEKYYGEWWGMFTGQLVFGPVMAFFLWLSLATVASTGGVVDGFAAVTTNVSSGYTEAFTLEVIRAYVIAVVMLLGGTKIATKMAGDTAGIAKSAIKQGTGGFVKAAKGTGRLLANAPILGTKDKTTGERVTLAQLGGSYGKSLQGTLDKSGWIGRSLGLVSKDRQDDINSQRQLASLKFAGRNDDAAALEKQLVQKGAEGLGKKYNADQLKKVMNDEGVSQLDRQRAMLALAQKGDDSLKGLGMDISKEVGRIGGSADFEMQIREALKAKGDEDAMLKKPDDVKKITDKLVSAKQAANFYAGIDQDAMPGIDGKMKRRATSDFLLEVDKDTYNEKDFKKGVKEQINTALMLAAKYETDPAKRAKLLQKYQDLTGAAMDPVAQQAAIAKAEGKRIEARAGKARAGTYAYKSIDKAAQQLLGEDGGTEALLGDMRNIQSRLAAGETPAALAGEFGAVIAGLDKAGASASGKDSIASDGSGKPLDNADAIKQSDIYGDVSSASASGDAKDASNRMKAAVASLEESLRQAKVIAQLSPEQRVLLDKAMTASKNMMTGAGSGLDDALASGLDVEKLAKAKKFAKQGLSAIDKMVAESQGTLSQEVAANVETLKTHLQELKSASEFTAQAVQHVTDAKAAIDKIAKQV